MESSICRKLSVNFSVSVNPGDKFICPSCHKYSASVMKNDKFACCFGPECGWRLSIHRVGSYYKKIIKKPL